MAHVRLTEHVTVEYDLGESRALLSEALGGSPTDQDALDFDIASIKCGDIFITDLSKKQETTYTWEILPEGSVT